MFSLAHVKWFTSEDSLPTVEALTFNEYVGILLFAGIGLWVLKLVDQWLVKNKVHKAIDKKLKPLSKYVPDIVRYTTATLLLLNAWYSYVLAPNIVYTGNDVEVYIGAGFVLAAAMLLLGGVLIRPAAILMLLAYISTYFLDSPLDAFDHLEYVGIALYLFFVGETKSLIKGLDTVTPSKLKPYVKLAPRLLCIFVGAGLIVLAFSEKIFALDVAQDFLNNYNWNFLESAGLSDRMFILMAGSMELLVGLSLIFNIGTRLTTLALLIIMLITGALLGFEEVLGHLFAVGVVAVIWIPHKKRA